MGVVKEFKCAWCGVPMSGIQGKGSGRGGSNQKYCRTCVPDPSKDRYRNRIAMYGVDNFMFEAMYFEQDGQCAMPMCSKEAVAVDHDHKTGKARGLLCIACNVALGHVEDFTNRALEYLKDYV